MAFYTEEFSKRGWVIRVPEGEVDDQSLVKELTIIDYPPQIE